MEDKLFIRRPQDWDWCFEESHRLKEHAKARMVENGIVLPLVPVPPEELPHFVLNTVCHGGVCDRDGNFVAGHRRDLNRNPANLDCWEAYPIDEAKLVSKPEKVVFGGILYEHFGLTITESLSRLWYVVENDFDKVVFLRYPAYERTLSVDSLDMIELLGIPKEKIEVVEEPTRYEQIIVPDEAFVSFSGYMPEFKKPFQEIAKRVAKESTPKKIYLTRTAFQENDEIERPRYIINEEYFEDFFSRRGFAVVRPEQLDLKDQIALIYGADEIVATLGTLTHMLLFARPDVTATILIRDTPLFIQSNVDQACGIEPYYVDADSNPLPVDHEHGPTLLVPNRFFRQYLDARGIAYDETELDWEPRKGALIMDFLRQWAAMYRKPGAASLHIADETMFDAIRRMNDALFDSTFDEDAYQDADRLNQARLERDELTRQINELYGSRSWMITEPLRRASEILHREYNWDHSAEKRYLQETGIVARDIEVQLMRTRFDRNRFNIVGFLSIQGISEQEATGVELSVSISCEEGCTNEPISLDRSASERCQDRNDSALFSFRYSIDLSESRSFTFIISLNGSIRVARIDQRSSRINFSRELGDIVRLRTSTVRLYRERGTIAVDCNRTHILSSLAQRPKQPKDVRALRLLIGALQKQKNRTSKQIWLYIDAPGRLDNAWLQFLHDIEQSDGVDRYYITHAETPVPCSLEAAEHAAAVPFGSRQHKILHYLADKRLCSDITNEVIVPWSDSESDAWYRDFDNAEQIYLQHGVLWAHLPQYYSFENTGMEREVVSTGFEIENLTKHYGFAESDLIRSGMPRYDFIPHESEPKKRILICPSWRGYLVGPTSSEGITPTDDVFLRSSYYTNLMKLISDEQLRDSLLEHGYTVDVKLHPNFKCYEKHFASLEAPYQLVGTVEDESRYAIVVTDYSSYSFDFVYQRRAIVYYIPDEREFSTGWNHYDKLDMSLEDAFGELAHSPEEASAAIRRIIDNGGLPLPTYLKRQSGVFLHYDNLQRSRLYRALMQS